MIRIDSSTFQVLSDLRVYYSNRKDKEKRLFFGKIIIFNRERKRQRENTKCIHSLLHGSFDSFLFNLIHRPIFVTRIVARFSNAGRITNVDRVPANVELRFDHITSGSGCRRDDG